MSPPTSLPDLPSDSEDTPAAGPSKRKLEPTTKRKSRRNSDESTAITRSPSPASRKKRQPTNDEDDFVEKVKSVAGRRRKTEDGKNLVIPASSTPVRSTSPTKQDLSDILSSALRLGQGNPKWFKSSEIGIFTEHKDIVNAVAWSPANHDLLASASNDTSARIWDFTQSSRPNITKLELTSTEPNPSHLHHKTIESSKNPVNCISWNAAGTLLATGAKEGTARTFSASGYPQHVLTQGTNLAITAIKFSPNGRNLMSGSRSHTTRILDVSGGHDRLLGEWKTHSGESVSSRRSRRVKGRTLGWRPCDIRGWSRPVYELDQFSLVSS
jgi:transducin (beta)-like 1